MRHLTYLLMASGLCFLWSGCGRSAEYGYVSGTVTLDGQPLKDAFVVFFPEDADIGTTAYGKTDSDGFYEMSISDAHGGILPGSYRVDIHTTDIAVDDNGRESWLPELVPAKYNRKSELTGYQVDAGKSHEFNFELKAEGQ